MKYRILSVFVLLSSVIFSQQIDFKSPQNVKLFADFLFCEKDYLRAIDEYEKYLTLIKNDTISFKIAYAFMQMGNYENAIEKFSGINSTSVFYESSGMEKLKGYFLIKDSISFYSKAESIIESKSEFSDSALKLKNTSLLLGENLFSKDELLFPFNDNEKKEISDFYDWKKNPPYKSEVLAGILSTIIPGAGKIYTENYSDGITAFILTGLFGYLAYNNFDHNHDFRAWTFTGLSTLFYAGNIYGSVASAQIFNARLNFDFENGVKMFLENKNYFTPNYDFCK